MTVSAPAYMGASVLIELGWPAKALSPNARVHHMEKYRFAKASKDTAFWATKAVLGAAKFPHDGTRVSFVVTAYPPDRQARDDDNLIASLKWARDGIAKALGIDDKFFDQRLQWGEPVKHGRVVVEIKV
jgi:crossover junction endodeoxyribonuclease RusA